MRADIRERSTGYRRAARPVRRDARRAGARHETCTTPPPPAGEMDRMMLSQRPGLELAGELGREAGIDDVTRLGDSGVNEPPTNDTQGRGHGVPPVPT